MSDHVRVLEILNEWLSDKRFHNIANCSFNRNVLNEVSLVENQRSDILAWLLNPMEGHGLGDFFIRKMLLEFCRDDGVSDIVGGASNVFLGSWGDFIVAREVAFDGGKGRIDIVMINEAKKLVLVIERKAGDKVSANQLNKYDKWMRDGYEKYGKIKVVSDSEGLEQDVAKEMGWLVSDEEWLKEAIIEALSANMVPEASLPSLSLFLSYLDDDYNISGDSGKVDSDVETFVRSHAISVKEIKRLNLCGHQVVDIDSRVLISKVMPEIKNRIIDDRERSIALQTGQLLAKYHEIMDLILDADVFSELKSQIVRSYPEIFLFNSYGMRNGGYCFEVTTKSLYNGVGYWPFWINIQADAGGEGQDQINKEGVVNIQVRLNKARFVENGIDMSVANYIMGLFGKSGKNSNSVLLRDESVSWEDIGLVELRPLLDIFRDVEEYTRRISRKMKG